MFLLRWVGAHSKDLSSSDMKKFVNIVSYLEGDSASVSQCSCRFIPHFLRNTFAFDIEIHQAVTCLFISIR
jgi:hypothetical protein